MKSELNSTCLSAEQMQQLADNSLLPAEVASIEAHVNHCADCRELLESRSLDECWQSEILPGLLNTLEFEQENLHDETSIDWILKLLGPTDDPQMLGRIAG